MARRVPDAMMLASEEVGEVCKMKGTTDHHIKTGGTEGVFLRDDIDGQ